VVSGRHDASGSVVQIAGGHEVGADVLLAAPGMQWRRLELDGMDELLGRGTYYGAGRSEATQCRGDDLAKSMSAYLVERIGRHPQIDVRPETQVTELHADGGHLAGVTITDAG